MPWTGLAHGHSRSEMGGVTRIPKGNRSGWTGASWGGRTGTIAEITTRHFKLKSAGVIY